MKLKQQIDHLVLSIGHGTYPSLQHQIFWDHCNVEGHQHNQYCELLSNDPYNRESEHSQVYIERDV